MNIKSTYHKYIMTQDMEKKIMPKMKVAETIYAKPKKRQIDFVDAKVSFVGVKINSFGKKHKVFKLISYEKKFKDIISQIIFNYKDIDYIKTNKGFLCDSEEEFDVIITISSYKIAKKSGIYEGFYIKNIEKIKEFIPDF